ncbi:MAG: nitrite/sulfite reductase [Acidobacteriota bacterium]
MKMPPARLSGRTRPWFASEDDIDEFVDMLARFEAGDITAAEWKAFRLVRGTYGQRQEGDVQMLRVKIPQGILDRGQLDALADVAARYSRGFAHLTTRQNVQVHFVKLADVEPALRHLAASGLTTREACGHAVRNITTCPWAGVSLSEPFDVTPFAEAMTNHLLRHPLSSTLPRKFKIAFEGCADGDHAFAAINDIGFSARIDTASCRLGFAVTVGGGTSIWPRSGRLLTPFLPAGDILELAEAMLRVFHRLGDRQRLYRNRLKFLIKSTGWDAWQAAVETERSEIRRSGGVPLPFHADRPPVETAPHGQPVAPPSVPVLRRLVSPHHLQGPGLLPVPASTAPGAMEAARWRRSNVRRQHQPGFVTVLLTTPLGDLTVGQMRACGWLAEAFGDGLVRTTHAQDLLLRWVPEAAVDALHRRLCTIGLGRPDAGTIADVTSCPGAESCKLAVTRSRGLAHLLSDRWQRRPDRVDLAGDLTIRISGCPNGCGLHHVAGLGLQGSARKFNGRFLPQYLLLAGGGSGPDGARFGRRVAKIPARRVAAAIERLLDVYAAEHLPHETATDFFQRVDPGRLRAAVADLAQVRPEDLTEGDLCDLGETAPFAPRTTAGECAS